MSNKFLKNFHTSENTLSILNDLSESLVLLRPEEHIKIFPTKVCEILSVPICIIWKKVPEQDRFDIAAFAGQVDDEYQKTQLSSKHPGVSFLLEKNEILSLYDVNKFNLRFRLADHDEVRKRGWISLMSSPVRTGKDIVGIMNVFTVKKRNFKSWEKEVFNILASHAALSFQKADLLKEKGVLERELEKQKPHKLTKLMQDMAEISCADKLFEFLLNGALELVSTADGWVCKLDNDTGRFEIVDTNRELNNHLPLNLESGITGKCLQEEKPIRVDDVYSDEWKKTYIKCWEDTQSEIAIPILIDKVTIRTGHNTSLGSKLFGVLNIESSKVKAFSQEDENRIWLLTRFAAMLLDRLEYNQKLDEIRSIEKKLLNIFTYEQIIKTIREGITKALELEVFYISSNPGDTKIKPELEVSWKKSESGKEEHRQDALYDLDSKIEKAQADYKKDKAEVVRDKRIKVVRGKHLVDEECFIVALIPMIQSTSQVLGIVEVGYRCKYRKHIYEREIRILENFVNYAAHALEREITGFITKITHEFKSPIEGIRSNASFLQRRFKQLDRDYIDIKLGDILQDGKILLYQVGELEYILGDRDSQQLNLQNTVVFRDVVIKTINQLKTTLQEFNFSVNNIIYNPTDSRKIIVYTDPFKLNQVVYNLLINSIKYANKEPKEFRIVIELYENEDNFIVEFSDWGIGIKKEDRTKIFQQGFRTEEAIKKDVSGSGLGLTISKDIMLQLGGDLKLIRHCRPTTFHMIIPKRISKE